MVGWARRSILWCGRMELPRLMGRIHMVSGGESEEGLRRIGIPRVLVKACRKT